MALPLRPSGPARTLSNVKRILLTGMSGTRKSSVIRELFARGYKAVDTDDGWFEPQPDGRQMWREDAIQTLLTTEDADVLLNAPLETLVERLATRTNNSYGKAPEELRRFQDDVNIVEPLLRRVATHEVRTTAPLDEVVMTILHLVKA